MIMSPTLTSLAPALATAQGELEDASKSSVNPAFRSKYADLAEVLQTLRPVLSKHGLALVQTVGHYDTERKQVQVTTMLLHKSGEYVADTQAMRCSKDDAQGIGSAVTYARRYGAAAICGISQADDDGNGASARAAANDNEPAKSKSKSKPAPEADQGVVDTLLAELEAVTSDEQLQAIAPRFAKLAATDQTKVLPAVKAARARLGTKAAA